MPRGSHVIGILEVDKADVTVAICLVSLCLSLVSSMT